MTDLEVKNKLKEIWESAAADAGESIRVIPRWKLAIKGKEWMSALRSINSDKEINGVYITRTSRQSRREGFGNNRKFHYTWTYSMFYFLSYNEGLTASDKNSEDRLNEFLEILAEKFEDDTNLDLDYIDDHSQLQVDSIDTVDLKVHLAQCRIVINITKQN